MAAKLQATSAAESVFTLEAHPAERGRRKQSVTVCAGCCCCCCCCVHTVGGLLAAAMGSDVRPATFEQRKNPFFKNTPSAAGPYWLSVLAGCVLVALWSVLKNKDTQEGVNVAFLYLLLGLPFFQPGASVFAAFLILLDHRYEDKTAYLGSLGRITAYSLAGALAGLALMFFTCIGFSFIGR